MPGRSGSNIYRKAVWYICFLKRRNSLVSSYSRSAVVFYEKRIECGTERHTHL